MILTENLEKYKPLKDCSKKMIKNSKQQIFDNLITGLNVMHQKNICNNNLKPENIFINMESLQIKYIDFLSSIHKDNFPSVLHYYTLHYILPSIRDKIDEKITFEEAKKNDIYAIFLIMDM